MSTEYGEICSAPTRKERLEKDRVEAAAEWSREREKEREKMFDFLTGAVCPSPQMSYGGKQPALLQLLRATHMMGTGEEQEPSLCCCLGQHTAERQTSYAGWMDGQMEGWACVRMQGCMNG